MKKMTLAALAAAVLGAGLSTAPEVVNNQMAQEGISQQQVQRTATNQNQNQKAPVQRTYQRTNDIYNMPGGFLYPLMRSGDIGPKEYGQWLQRTGRQWQNLRARRSRKYRC